MVALRSLLVRTSILGDELHCRNRKGGAGARRLRSVRILGGGLRPRFVPIEPLHSLETDGQDAMPQLHSDFRGIGRLARAKLAKTFIDALFAMNSS